VGAQRRAGELEQVADETVWPGVADPVRLLNEITAWLCQYGNHGTRSTYATGLGLPTGVTELRAWLSSTPDGNRVGGVDAAGWGRALRDYADALDLTDRLAGEVVISVEVATGADSARSRPGRYRELHWLRWCAAQRLDPLATSTHHVHVWLDDLAGAGAAPTTRDRMLATLRTLYQHLATVGLVPANPADVNRRTLNLTNHDSTSSTIVLTPTQVAALYDTAGRPRRGASAVDVARARAAVGLLTLGLRVSEMCGLDRADLHVTRGRRALRVHGKGGKHRIVYLTDLASTALDGYLAAQAASRPPRPSPRPGTATIAPAAGRLPAPGPSRPTVRPMTERPLLVSRGAVRCTRHGIYQLLRRVALAAGPELADIATAMHPHALRHFYVTTSVEAGAEMSDVQADVGHASIDTTRRVYDHAARTPDRSAADLVAGAITAARKNSAAVPGTSAQAT
jgi:site-specific recombinase XerD